MDRSVDDWPLIGQLIPFYPWPLSKRSPTMSSCSLWPLFGDSWLWCSQGSVDTFMTVFLSWRSSTIAATWYSSRVDTVPCRFCLVTIAATWYSSRVDTVPCRWEYFFCRWSWWFCYSSGVCTLQQLLQHYSLSLSLTISCCIQGCVQRCKFWWFRWSSICVGFELCVFTVFRSSVIAWS